MRAVGVLSVPVVLLFISPIPWPITKKWVTPSYAETGGPIVHSSEVNGVVETEGAIAAAGVDLDRYTAFNRCFKGPKWIIGRFDDAVYFTCGGGVLMWPAAHDDGWTYWILRVVQRDCGWWDFDGDSDVDLQDFAGFQSGGG